MSRSLIGSSQGQKSKRRVSVCCRGSKFRMPRPGTLFLVSTYYVLPTTSEYLGQVRMWRSSSQGQGHRSKSVFPYPVRECSASDIFDGPIHGLGVIGSVKKKAATTVGVSKEKALFALETLL